MAWHSGLQGSANVIGLLKKCDKQGAPVQGKKELRQTHALSLSWLTYDGQQALVLPPGWAAPAARRSACCCRGCGC
jgi:hypothetical protein